MSVSLYKWTEECEQDPQCVGDCDLCRKETMIDKYDEAGIPTDALEYTDGVNLAMTGNATAKPASECVYPKCEDCWQYRGHYCTVPMVVSKQDWLSLHAWATKTTNRLTELETLFTDEILGSKERRVILQGEDPNLTWADYFKEQE